MRNRNSVGSRELHPMHNENNKKIMIMASQMSLIMEKLSNRVEQDYQKSRTVGGAVPFPPGPSSHFLNKIGVGSQ